MPRIDRRTTHATSIRRMIEKRRLNTSLCARFLSLPLRPLPSPLPLERMIYPYGSIEVEGWEYLYPFSKNAFPSLHPLHSGNGMERILQDLVRVKGRSLPSSPILKANRRTSLLRLVRGNFTVGGGEFDGRYRKGWEIRNYTNAADTILPLRDTPYHAPRHWNDLPRAPPSLEIPQGGRQRLGWDWCVGISEAFCRRSIDRESGGKQRFTCSPVFYAKVVSNTLEDGRCVGNLWPGTVQ